LPPPRLRRIWLFLGWCFAAYVVYVSLTPSPPEIAHKIWDKATHLLAYVWLMLWFAQLHQTLARKARTALALIGMGIAVEILQGVGGVRHADAFDALANALGVGGGLLLSCTPLGTVLRWLEHKTTA
jgi:VanZ family protein